MGTHVRDTAGGGGWPTGRHVKEKPVNKSQFHHRPARLGLIGQRPMSNWETRNSMASNSMSRLGDLHVYSQD